MERYILKTPIDFEGKKITELMLDLENLTPSDSRKAEKIAKNKNSKKKRLIAVLETDPDYIMALAAIASGKPIEFFDCLKLNDYTAVKYLVQNFLLSADSEDTDEETEEK